MRKTLKQLIETTIKHEASDLHLIVGAKPSIRVRRKITGLDTDLLTKEDTSTYLEEITSQVQRAELERDGKLDFSYRVSAGGVTRVFRGNASRESKGIAIALRLIAKAVKSPEALGLTETVLKLVQRPQGLILVTGATGSGKSTTLASLIGYITSPPRESRRIVTIEQPIEYPFSHGNGLVTQFDVPVDVPSFGTALRSSLRQDPDVIMIGELRDAETIEVAMQAAETGHLVLSTLHTNSAVESLSRIFGLFPEEKHQHVRTVLSSALTAVISQRLLPNANEDGLVLAYELLVNVPIVAEAIRDGKYRRVAELLENDDMHGMHSLDQYLLKLVESEKVTQRHALAVAHNPEQLHRWIKKVG